MSELFSLDTTCRTCLASLNVEPISLYDEIFIQDQSIISIKDILKSSCYIKISQDDGLPKAICLNCRKKIKEICIFRLQCERSEKILKRHLSDHVPKPSMNETMSSLIDEVKSSNIESSGIFKDSNIIANNCTETIKSNLKNNSICLRNNKIINEKSFYCSQCNLFFNWKIRYNEHIRKFHKFTINNIVYKKYSCESCRKTFRMLSNLEKHKIKCGTQSTVNYVSKNNCTYCKSEFDDNFELSKHVKMEHSEDGPNVCANCKKSFKLISQLEKHLKTHITSDKYSCSSCNKLFCNEKNLQKHIAKQHLQPHICNICGKNFLNHRKLRLHKTCHTEESDKKYQCKYCIKKFNQIHHLENHERIHTGQKPYLCSECGKGFRQQYALTLHMRIHTGVKPYICQECGKTFNRKQGLDSHLLCHNGKRDEDGTSDDNVHICSDCGIRVTRLRTLLKHMWQVHNKGGDLMIDTPIRQVKSVKKQEDKVSKGFTYNCNVCHVTFQSNLNLKQHMKIHTFQYTCDVCSRAFMLPSQLEAHARFHTGSARLHSCSYPGCTRSFNRPEHVRAHYMRAHTTERPYQCEICLKGFCQSGDLKVHMRYHTGERPFDCTFCDKSFAASSALRGHVRRHTGERPYCCAICCNGYYTSTELNLHMKSHTSKNIDISTELDENKIEDK